jgi:hypothetical protein
MSIVTVELVIEQDSFDKLYHFCTNIPSVRRGSCFGEAANRMVQIDPSYTKTAIEICGLAKKAGLEKDCYESLVRFAHQALKPESQEFKDICKSAPGSVSSKCTI